MAFYNELRKRMHSGPAFAEGSHTRRAGADLVANPRQGEHG